MNKWKALLPVVTAFAEGKVIQERIAFSDKWMDIRPGVTPAFSMDVENYRVKPEPREFYINIYAGGCMYLHTSELAARNGCTLNGKPSATTIKVREVIND